MKRKLNKNDEPQFIKEKHKILIPDLFPVHMELIADVIRSYGYDAEVLHCTDKAVLDTGLKYIHNDMCYPAICSVGQLLYAVESGKYDLSKIALMQFQTGGGCRASNYVMMLKKALKKMGLNNIPVITLGFASLTGSNGFKVTIKMVLRALLALVYGDALMLLKNQVQPYERIKGATAHVYDKWYNKARVEILYKDSRFKRLGLGWLKDRELNFRRMKKNIIEMAADFGSIEVVKEPKIKVGVVGEVYVKYAPLGNNHLEDFLSEQDCEYMMPGVLGFMHYCLTNVITDYRLYGGSRLRKMLSKLAGGIIAKYEKALTGSIATASNFVVPPSFSTMQKYGSDIINMGVKMGEGWYLSAEVVELISHGFNNIICVQPFGCLPNHIVAKGVARRIKELYPAANLCFIDYDASASAVNQENRMKLMFEIAKSELREKCANDNEKVCDYQPAENQIPDNIKNNIIDLPKVCVQQVQVLCEDIN